MTEQQEDDTAIAMSDLLRQRRTTQQVAYDDTIALERIANALERIADSMSKE